MKAEQPQDVVTGLASKIAMSAIKKLSDSTKKDSDIKWNFTKFLVNREGKVIKRYSPTYAPEKIEADIKELL